jgi:hypothetical protein
LHPYGLSLFGDDGMPLPLLHAKDASGGTPRNAEGREVVPAFGSRRKEIPQEQEDGVILGYFVVTHFCGALHID